MNAEELRLKQEPLKQQYRLTPESAKVTMKSSGKVDFEGVACRVSSPLGEIVAGLHPAAGGNGHEACSGEMLLDSLIACAGVTMAAVATALSIPIRSAAIHAEGDMDFRGTLGIDRQTPVGLTDIRLRFEIDSEASQEQLEKLLQLTERYCVIFQTLTKPISVHCGLAGR